MKGQIPLLIILFIIIIIIIKIFNDRTYFIDNNVNY